MKKADAKGKKFLNYKLIFSRRLQFNQKKWRAQSTTDITLFNYRVCRSSLGLRHACVARSS